MKKKKSKKKAFSFSSSRLLDFQFSDLSKQRPSKHALNIVIGFDTTFKLIIFMRVFGLDFSNAEFDHYSYSSHFLDEEFFVSLDEVLKKYLASLPSSHQLACYVMLPNEVVTIDDIALPVLSKKKIEESLEIELKKLYRNYKDLYIKKYISGSNKQYLVYNITLLRKAYLNNIYKILSVNKLYPKNASYCSNCSINSILQFKPQYKKKSFILLDIKVDQTIVSVSLHGKTYGFSKMMLGTIHLQDDKMLQENMQYDHDVADLAIINAKEKAKMKQLTIDGQEALEEVADSVSDQLAEGINKNEVVDLDNNLDTQIVDSEFEEELTSEVNVNVTNVKKKKVFARKMPKRLPKFMVRDEPTSKEGYVYENFRMFVKWALLYNMQLQRLDYLGELDFALINIDEKYKYLIEMANEEENNLKFVYLENIGENVNSHLDLIGTLYCGLHNKRQNF